MIEFVKKIWMKWNYQIILFLFVAGIAFGNVIYFRTVTVYKIAFFLASLIFIFWLIRRKKLVWHHFFTLFAIYILTTFLLFGISENPHSMTRKIFYIIRIGVHFLFLYFIYTVFDRGNVSLLSKVLLFYVLAGSYLNALVSGLQLFGNVMLPQYLYADKVFLSFTKVEGVWLDNNYNGAFIVTCLMLLLYLKKRRSIGSKLFSITLVLNMVVLFFTNSLGSYISFIIGLLIYLIWDLKAVYRYFILAIVAFLAYLVFYSVFPNLQSGEIYKYSEKNILVRGKTLEDAMSILDDHDYFTVHEKYLRDINTEEDLSGLLNYIVRDYTGYRMHEYFMESSHVFKDCELFPLMNKIHSEYLQTHFVNRLYVNRLALDYVLKGTVKNLNIFLERNSLLPDIVYYVSVKLSYGSFGSRREQNQVASRAFKEHPVFGIGIMGFENKENQYKYLDRLKEKETNWGIIHNNYLATLSENGIVGFLFYIALLGSALWFSYKLHRRDGSYKGILSLVIATAVFSFGINTLFWQVHWFILFLPHLLWEIEDRGVAADSS